MKLRDYQEDLIQKTRQSFRTPRRVLCVAPCGAGKTVMFAWMCQEHLRTHPDGYVWFLVHRQELIDQTNKTFEACGIDTRNILIGMVQTVARRLDTARSPSLIVFDEAHHSAARTWTKIIERYPNAPIVGLTATPCRNDGASLGSIYEDMQTGVTARKLIDMGYLSEYDYYAPQINLQEASWKIRGSEYDMSDVAERFDKAKIYGDVKKVIDPSKKTIIYCPSIEFSKKLCQQIPGAVHFDGDTPKEERRSIIQRFREGEIKILSNVDLIGEGFDVPDCDCCVLLRPTMSVALYIQQSMRCMRPAFRKRAAIYDLVGNVFKHGLPDEDREWSLTKKIRMRNQTGVKDLIVRECQECYRVYKGNGRICPYCGHDNGKTASQIEEEKKAELVKIEAMEKKKLRQEVGRARTFEELLRIGRERGYNNPAAWARIVMKSRKII